MAILPTPPTGGSNVNSNKAKIDLVETKLKYLESLVGLSKLVGGFHNSRNTIDLLIDSINKDLGL